MMNNEKVVLITGANSGMGKASAVEMAKRGYKVVMLCRDLKRGEEALRDVIEKSGSRLVYLEICDLGSLTEIRKFCRSFKEKYSSLNILINNAGVILPKRHLTKDGYELQFGVNHLGHFLVTNLLLDLILKSPPARIINVSSGAHKIGKIYFEDINLEKSYSTIKAYSRSKLANILFTYELARRLKGTGVTVNCLHPGAVATKMGISRDTGFGTLLTTMLKPFFQTPEKGAETAIYLATASEVEKVTGKYFYRKKAIASSKRTYDVELAKKLWCLSEELTALKGE